MPTSGARDQLVAPPSKSPFDTVPKGGQAFVSSMAIETWSISERRPLLLEGPDKIPGLIPGAEAEREALPPNVRAPRQSVVVCSPSMTAGTTHPSLIPTSKRIRSSSASDVRSVMTMGCRHPSGGDGNVCASTSPSQIAVASNPAEPVMSVAAPVVDHGVTVWKSGS